MKKHIIIILALALLLASCTLEPKPSKPGSTKKSLTVISNVSEDGTVVSRSINPEHPVTGVLLKFHFSGLWGGSNSYFADSYSSEKGFENPNAFYIEYVGEGHKNGGGMVYNYVLYVPDAIFDAYFDGNGKNPSSGNPFWWYMKTYLGKNLSTIKRDWKSVVEYLLENRTGLPYPDKKDVTGTWNASYVSLNQTKNSQGIKLGAAISSLYIDEDTDEEVWPTEFMFLDECVAGYDGGDKTVSIIIPDEISTEYAAASGDISYISALLWYFSTYYNISEETIKNAFINDNLNTLLSDAIGDGPYIKPNMKDVYSVTTINNVSGAYESNESMQVCDMMYYGPGILKLADGTMVENCDRVYLQTYSDGTVCLWFPKTFIDQSKEAFEAKGENYNSKVDFAIDFFLSYCDPSMGELMDLQDYVLSSRLVDCLLQYRTTEGFRNYAE